MISGDLNLIELMKMKHKAHKKCVQIWTYAAHASYQRRWGKSNNQSPKGTMRSAVPLPCFFDDVKSQRVAGQWPRQGTKSSRMGRNSVNPFVSPSVRLSICLSAVHLKGQKAYHRVLGDYQRGLRA